MSIEKDLSVIKFTWPYLAPLVRYGKLLAKNRQFFVRLPSHLTSSIRVTPFKFLDLETMSLCGSQQGKLRDPSLHRFNRI